METKGCKVCSLEFSRPPTYSNLQWESRFFCSKICAQEQKRAVKRAKHRCKDCGGKGPFNTYKTMHGRISQRSRCVECQNTARRSTRDRVKQRTTSRAYRDRLKKKAPERISHSKAWAAMNPEKYLFSRLRHGFAKRGARAARLINFDQFMIEIGGKMPEVCPILGIRMDITASSTSDNLPTVDRIDSSKPYQPGNIAVISWKANRLKNNGTAEDHRRIAEWMSRHQGGPSC